MTKSADAFRTISEVADWLGVQTHVLRFWESKFTQVKPVKRAGGRRYYRPADMLLLGGIRKLLHEDGLTIKGVQKILREEGMAHVADLSQPLDDETSGALDSDLVTRIGEDVDLPAPTAPERSLIDQSPERTLMEGPFGDEDDDGADDEYDQTPRAPAPLPTFMRPLGTAPTPEPAAPTLTSDFTPNIEVAPPAPTPAPNPEDASPDWNPPLEHVARDATAAADDQLKHDPVDDTHVDDTHVAEADGGFDPAPEIKAMGSPAPVGDASGPDTGAPPDEAAAQGESLDDPAPAPAPAPVPRRARIVHAPDEPDPDAAEIAPSVLGRAALLKRVTPAQAEALRPLVAQLTALRDQMTRARHDPN